MSIICLKCPHCGGDINLDNSRDYGFCIYCGSKIKIQQDINNINISVSLREQVGNLKQLMIGHYVATRYDDALELAQKIIELNGADADVWYLAAQCILNKSDYRQALDRKQELKLYLDNYSIMMESSEDILDDELLKHYPNEHQETLDREIDLQIKKELAYIRDDNPNERIKKIKKLLNDNPTNKRLIRAAIIASLICKDISTTDIMALLHRYNTLYPNNMNLIKEDVESIHYGKSPEEAVLLWKRSEECKIDSIKQDFLICRIAMNSNWNLSQKDIIFRHFFQKINKNIEKSLDLSQISKQTRGYISLDLVWGRAKAQSKEKQNKFKLFSKHEKIRNGDEVIVRIKTSQMEQTTCLTPDLIESTGITILCPSIIEISLKHSSTKVKGKYLIFPSRSSENQNRNAAVIIIKNNKSTDGLELDYEETMKTIVCIKVDNNYPLV